MTLRFRIIFSILMAFCLSLIMTGLVSFLNIGFSSLYLAAWRRAFFIAWPIGTVVSFLFAPHLYKLTSKIDQYIGSKTN